MQSISTMLIFIDSRRVVKFYLTPLFCLFYISIWIYSSISNLTHTNLSSWYFLKPVPSKEFPIWLNGNSIFIASQARILESSLIPFFLSSSKSNLLENPISSHSKYIQIITASDYLNCFSKPPITLIWIIIAAF